MKAAKVSQNWRPWLDRHLNHLAVKAVIDLMHTLLSGPTKRTILVKIQGTENLCWACISCQLLGLYFISVQLVELIHCVYIYIFWLTLLSTNIYSHHTRVLNILEARRRHCFQRRLLKEKSEEPWKQKSDNSYQNIPHPTTVLRRSLSFSLYQSPCVLAEVNYGSFLFAKGTIMTLKITLFYQTLVTLWRQQFVNIIHEGEL